MRRGEVLDPRWADVDLDAYQLEVVQQLALERGRPVLKAVEDREQRPGGDVRACHRRRVLTAHLELQLPPRTFGSARPERANRASRCPT